VVDEPKPRSKKWKLFPVVAWSFLAGLVFTAYNYYWIDGGEKIAYWLSLNRHETIGRLIGHVLAFPIICTIVTVIHNLFVK